jgi:hypothetical protein
MKQVKDVDWSKYKNNPKIIRAGIIPFLEQNGVLFFAFSVDFNIASLGDFGGHFEPTDTDLLDAAIREYREEALNVFGLITRDSLKDCYVLEGDETVEILMYINPPFYQYTELFNSMVIGQKEHEVQNVVWLSKQQLLRVIDSQQASFAGTKIYHMYHRVYDCLLKNRHFLS